MGRHADRLFYRRGECGMNDDDTSYMQAQLEQENQEYELWIHQNELKEMEKQNERSQETE